MPEAYPVLRGEIDAAPANRDGESYYILYDRAGVAGARLLVSPMGLLIAGRLDGTASVLEIADALAGEYGEGVAYSDVETIIAALDEAYFLDNARFGDCRAQAERDFRDAPVRAAASAGSAYPDDAAALAAALDAILADAPPPEEFPGGDGSFPRGVIAPHIDYARGAAGYGQLYACLRSRPAPKTVVILGTAHTRMRERYALCEKDFATPLGVVPADRALCAAVRESLSGCGDPDCDILAHRAEHSLELQAVWLRHIYGDAVSIVPLLVASAGGYLDGERAPREALTDPAHTKMAAVLAKAVASGGVMLMASADLAHVGPRFGDEGDLTDSFLAAVEEADRAYLEAVRRDPLSGLENLAANGDGGDRFRVCGAGAVFALGMALFGAKARLLGYHQAVTPEMEQAVSFAAMVME